MIPFMDRREFVKDSVVGAAIAAAGLDFSKVEARAAVQEKTDIGSQLRVAVVGVNGRGMSHVGGFA
ncbi:MAG: gfo/Idh/MocA family oxidoreductase, partial [Gemmataceae bacterium]